MIMSTLQEAHALDMLQLYQWSNSGEMILSQYGHIKIEKWLECEQKRIAADPTRRALVVLDGKRMTLFGNDMTIR